jgi:rod shape determining protein RodA
VELTVGPSRPVRSGAWKRAPWPLLAVALVIAGLGVWNLASASRDPDEALRALSPGNLPSTTTLWKSQLAWIGLGLLSCLAMMLFDYRWLLKLAWPIYAGGVGLLALVLAKGHAAMGARRWLDLGPLNLQPSELMKLAVVIVLAKLYHEDQRHPRGYHLPDLWLPALVTAVPVALVVKQPDLGTAMIITAIAGSVVLFGKVRLLSLGILGVSGLAASVLAWSHVLKTYQKRRVLSFLDPEGDMLGAGYHASQSLIAVGSGQGTGKGWMQGTQTQFSFLPEQHTDFIFSVWGEEHGFVGSMILLSLYLVLFLLALLVAAGAREKFGTFLAVGILAMLFWHVFVNIGMVTGLLPVVGVTLPLMSYGGSSVLTLLTALGLLMNVGMRRHLY